MTDDNNEGGSRTPRALAKDEIDEFLKKGFWAVLATSLNDEPYGVPVIYAYDDDGCFYIANGPGKKIQMLEKNPSVTLTVVEVEDYGKKWKSVIVYGRVEVLSELGDKLHAFNALRKQVPRPSARVRDAAKLAMAKVVRITPTEITGKSIGF
ncbi:MAG TPA: pyridoxamine 5'-phosphate oxidase family protein [Longimicrobiales bacterium]|nr:pyridoxamine 5'-phosphate oxidase family protein [Longimicrobiales bacterium]